MISQRSGNTGVFILLLSCFIYSMYGVFSRAIGTAIPQFFQIWTRAILIILIHVLVILFSKTKLLKIRKQDWPWGITIALSSGLLMPMYYIALNNLSIGTTLFTFYATSTIISYILGKFIYKEEFSKAKILSLILAVTGILFLYTDTLKMGNFTYILISSVSGLLFGTNLIAIKKINNTYPSLQVNLFNWSGGLAVSLIVSVFLKEHWSLALTSTPWLINLGLAFSSFVASFLVTYGFKHIEMQKGSIILLSELVFGVFVGLLFYREIPTPMALLGCALVFLALLIPNFYKYN